MATYGMEELEERYHEIRSRYKNDAKSRRQAIADLFVTTKRAVEFMRWKNDKDKPKHFELAKPKIPNREEFFSVLQNTDFSHFEQFALLTEYLTLSYAPYIPVGIRDSLSYRLYPTPHTLRSHTTSYNIPAGYELLPESFLAVNFGGLSHRDDENLDKQSVQPRQSSDDDTPPSSPPSTGPSIADGFIFYQLGKLEFCLEDYRNLKLEDVWIDARFVVVIRLLPDGTKGGIYILYHDNIMCDCGERHNEGAPDRGGFLPARSDWFSDDEDAGDHEMKDDRDDGIEPENESRIFCAKIAARFEDLGHGKQLQAESLPARTTEYSRVMRAPDGSFSAQGDGIVSFKTVGGETYSRVQTRNLRSKVGGRAIRIMR